MHPEQTDYSKLTLRDLLEAREQSHNSFINKRNVIGTAVGRYLIRLADIDKNGQYKPNSIKKVRTLENSVVTDFSWNCILVFVNSWEEEENLKEKNPTDVVPKFIQLRDGRYVPVCVVEAPKEIVSDTHVNINKLRFPENLIGGGFPLIIQSQGIRHIATVGCLVTDGHKYYALTNKHVAGVEGEKVNSVMGSVETEIGISSGIALGKVDFNDLYGGLPNSNILVSCDVGLIDIHDVSQWKTDVVEIGQMDELYDLNMFSLNLELIAEHDVAGGERQPSSRGLVIGHGAVSKKIKGEIAALFYRYKSVGGTEYVSDFLISGRDGKS
ncbi:MAG TPA: hypothetical protein VL443_20700 [Cyclobacteriaceae bacterium]|jgi:hypothetical protein|nr:hypothetical protein [Cyclobacteriaceae bacterium]